MSVNTKSKWLSTKEDSQHCREVSADSLADVNDSLIAASAAPRRRRENTTCLSKFARGGRDNRSFRDNQFAPRSKGGPHVLLADEVEWLFRGTVHSRHCPGWCG